MDVSVSGTWTGPEFCFPHGMEIFGEVARGPGQGLLLPAIQFCTIKASHISAESFPELHAKLKSLLYWLYLSWPKTMKMTM